MGSTQIGVDWSPDGHHIVVGGVISGTVRIRVYFVQMETSVSLVEVASTAADAGNIASVKWSPDGKHVLAGGIGDSIIMYRFTGNSLTQEDTELHGADVNAVDWFHDSNAVALGRSHVVGLSIRRYATTKTMLPAQFSLHNTRLNLQEVTILNGLKLFTQ